MTESKLILRRLESRDESKFLEAFYSWDLTDTGFLFAQGFEPGMKFEDYLDLLQAFEKGERLPQGFVPWTTLCGFVGDELVGRLSIRHQLSDFLFKIGGHIGYGVVPSQRQKGYAKMMLQQALPIAKSLGIEKALVTCDDTNIGSAKVIEACGGILENKVDAGEGRPLKRRYWIDISKSLNQVPGMEFKVLSGSEARPHVDALYKRNNKSHKARDTDVFFVAFDGDQAVGTVRFCVENGDALLRSMQIDEKYRRQGIGSKLLQMFDAYLNENKIRAVFCIPFAHLEGFYGQIGFRRVRTAEAPNFLQDRLEEYKSIAPESHYLLMKRA
jgi:predicted acetyltransferase